MKHSGEIHEQLVTYDEEGGGEMDTNGQESLLSSMMQETLSQPGVQNERLFLVPLPSLCTSGDKHTMDMMPYIITETQLDTL